MFRSARQRTCARGPREGIRRIALCSLAWVLPTLLVPAAAAQVKDAYELRAAILYNLSRFVNWRDEVFASPSAPLVIGVLGRDPFGPHLVEAVHGRTTTEDRPLEVVTIASIEDLDRCHMIFVTADAEQEHADWIARLDTAHVLLVGETLDLVQSGGGSFALILEGTRIRIHLNKAQADQAGLTIRAQLLRLCQMVQSSASR